MRAFTVFQWLFEASIGALVLVCLILPVRQLLRGKLGSKLIYALWLLVILRLLIPLRVPNPLLSVYPEYSENVIGARGERHAQRGARYCRYGRLCGVGTAL